MADRDDVIAAEQSRQSDLAERREQLLDEYNAIAKPVIEFRKVEAQMREIQNQLQTLSESDSARRGEFKRQLERVMPDELRDVLQAAKAELGARRRVESQNPDALRQLASLRDWFNETEKILRNPSVSSATLFEQAAIGRGLLSTEGTVARV